MTVLFLLAAAIALLLAAAHSYLGERYILIRLLRRSDLPRLFGGIDFTRRTLRLAWHLTSVAWVGFAGLLAAQALSPAASWRTQGQVISVTFGLSGIVALLGSRGRHLSWIGFFAVAALVWVALA